MSKPTLYCYNFTKIREMQIKTLCNSLGYIMNNVPLEHQNVIISDLISGKAKNVSGNCFTDEMVLLVGFDSTALSKLYSSLESEKIDSFKYKALLSDFNQRLTSLQLYKQLKYEA